MIARIGDSLLSFATSSSRHALRSMQLVNEFAQSQAQGAGSILTYVTNKWYAFKVYVVELWGGKREEPSQNNGRIAVDFDIGVFGLDDSDIDDDEDWEADYVPGRRWQMSRINAKYEVDRSTRKRTNKNRTHGVARDYKCRR